MVVRELVNQIVFQVTGQKQADSAADHVKKSLEQVGTAGQRAGGTASRGLYQIMRAASVASRSISALSKGIGAAAISGGRNLTPLRMSLNSISAAAVRARASILSMAAAGARASMHAVGTAAMMPVRGAGRAIAHPMRTAGAITGAVTSIPGIAAALGVYQIKQTADEVMNLDGRLRAVTKTDEERLAIEKQIYEVSQNNRQSMTAIGDLYVKVARAAKPMGYTSEQSMRVADIVSKALTSGGASTAEAQATILQLGQALQSGTLQGDELASLRENGGTLMTHMADAMGVSVADLKKMGAEGELTSEKVMNAILASGAAIDAEFAKMPMTIGQALQKASNRFSRFLMEVERRTSVFSGIAEGIDSAFDTVERYVNVMDQLRSGPQDGQEGIFSKLQEEYPILNAIATSLLPAIQQMGSSIESGWSRISDLWNEWGNNETVASLLSNVFGIVKDIWTILSPLAEFFGITLAAAITVVLNLLEKVSGIIKSISDFFAESFGGIVNTLSEVAGLFTGEIPVNRISSHPVYDSRTQTFSFYVNSPKEASDIGNGFVELSLNV